MIEATYWGRARHLAFSTLTVVPLAVARVWNLGPTTGGLILRLPDARLCRRGYPVGFLVNATGYAITLQDYAGGAIGTLAANQAARVGLASNSAAAGTWVVKISSLTTTTLSIGRRKGYVVGGTGSDTSRLDYDAGTDAWTSGTACPGAHVEGAFMPLGRRNFLVGSEPQVGGVSDKCHELDDLGSWTTRVDCPFVPARTCGAAVQGEGFIFSGRVANVGRYVLNAWAARTAIPYTKTRATAVGIGDKAYVISGEPVPIPNLAYWPTHDVFWSVAYQPSAARHTLSSFAIHGALFAMGGYLDSPVTRYSNVDEYAPGTDTWVVRAALGAGQRYGGAGFGGNARGHYCGGKDGADTATATAHAYLRDTWSALAPMPAARSEIANQGVAA